MSTMQFGQTGLSSTTLQPSQVSFIQFDPSSQLFGTNQILGTSQTQNVNNSQLMGNHMVQPSHRPSGLQIATPTTFYQQQPTLPQTPLQTPIQAPAPLQQSGFFPTQRNNTNLQVSFLQAFHHKLKLLWPCVSALNEHVIWTIHFLPIIP